MKMYYFNYGINTKRSDVLAIGISYSHLADIQQNKMHSMRFSEVKKGKLHAMVNRGVSTSHKKLKMK